MLFVVALSVFFLTEKGQSQNDNFSSPSLSANLDLMSRYIWRGQQYGKGPSIQPGLSLSWNDFTLGAWGAYEVFSEGSQETDFYLSKSIGAFTFAVWDYWAYMEDDESDFFNYSRNSTSHLLEGQITLSGSEKIPFNFVASYFFYGADPSKSIYLELQYETTLKNSDLMVFAGYQAKGNYYAENSAFVNIGATITKNVEITDRFALPVMFSLVCNPDRRNVQLVAGISF